MSQRIAAPPKIARRIPILFYQDIVGSRDIFIGKAKGYSLVSHFGGEVGECGSCVHFSVANISIGIVDNDASDIGGGRNFWLSQIRPAHFNFDARNLRTAFVLHENEEIEVLELLSLLDFFVDFDGFHRFRVRGNAQGYSSTRLCHSSRRVQYPLNVGDYGGVDAEGQKKAQHGHYLSKCHIEWGRTHLVYTKRALCQEGPGQRYGGCDNGAVDLQIHYPIKRFNITQHWGNPNSTYADHFGDPAWTKHNGCDFNTGYVDANTNYMPTEWPIYCPVENFKVMQVDYAPDGGGNEVWLVSKEQLLVGGTLCWIFLVLCHGKKVLVPVGYEPAVGDLLMIADSTGFSTGPHTHMGIYRSSTSSWVTKIDQNDATGSYNPELFFSGKYSADLATTGTLVSNAFRYYGYVLRG